ncbi:helix-turn-helix transcriptional regulator [Vibrio quintilis]|uniref:Uncharacterized protein n=1 Tax=Vibrio quintilis TaxID=1117707 RepID=A0A1M7YW02_9VIBR|nr:hypothetical protein [Vibrio quintilis]SHO56768.1 hypothetical protein VQ7734_02537 [Vibrio quintilis]
MTNKSINSVSIKKDNEIQRDCFFLKQLGIDYISLYLETPLNLSVISNLPCEMKMAYRDKELFHEDPMIRNKKHGLFMMKRDIKEESFSNKIKSIFSIHNIYARSSSIGATKISYVLGCRTSDYPQYCNLSDRSIINFSKFLVKKYRHDISQDLCEIKMSPINLVGDHFINRLFSDEQIEKPNYGELACLSLAKEGLDMIEISILTEYKINTVKSNLKNARIKLHARKTIDAVMTALSMGWIS